MPRPNTLAKAAPKAATQQYLDIREIREDVVVMKDGTLRGVLLASSINFALKSEDEQEAIVQAYISFLNTLEFPLQIVVQSRRMNIEAYLASLITQEQQTQNELLRGQIAEYRGFIMQLIELGDIMQKRFYVVVPYDPLRDRPKKFWSRLSEAVSPSLAVRLKEEQFLSRRDELFKRVSATAGALEGMGVTTELLDTQGLIELYYNVYNPDIFETQRLKDLSQIQVEDTP